MHIKNRRGASEEQDSQTNGDEISPMKRQLCRYCEHRRCRENPVGNAKAPTVGQVEYEVEHLGVSMLLGTLKF